MSLHLVLPKKFCLEQRLSAPDEKVCSGYRPYSILQLPKNTKEGTSWVPLRLDIDDVCSVVSTDRTDDEQRFGSREFE